MKRIARFSTLLVFVVGLTISFRAEAQAHGGDPEVPPTPTDCASECASNAFQAYWMGCRCGGEVWGLMECYECTGSNNCSKFTGEGAGGCFYENGNCYGWGTCHYTG